MPRSFFPLVPVSRRASRRAAAPKVSAPPEVVEDLRPAPPVVWAKVGDVTPGQAYTAFLETRAPLSEDEFFFGALARPAPPLFALIAQKDTPTVDDELFSADDFEFSDPDYHHLQAASKGYALSTPEGQDALLTELARHVGVQTVVLCSTLGQVLCERAPQGAAHLGSVVAATALLFRDRGLKLLSANLGSAVVCMRVVGPYCVAVMARGDVNVGRLLTELQQIEVAA